MGLANEEDRVIVRGRKNVPEGSVSEPILFRELVKLMHDLVVQIFDLLDP